MGQSRHVHEDRGQRVLPRHVDGRRKYPPLDCNGLTTGIVPYGRATTRWQSRQRFKCTAAILDVDDIAKPADEIEPERLKAFILISAGCG